MRWLIILTSLITSEASAQNSAFWAMPTQSTALYTMPDPESGVVTQVTSDEVLMVSDDGPWCMAWDRMGRHGYVHRSFVRPIEELSDSAAIQWMQNVFKKQESLGRQLDERFHAKDSLGTMAAGRAIDDHDYEHNAALSLFTPYYCRTGDAALLRSVMKSIAANSGSASEEPPYRLTLALECRPAEFKRTLASMDSSAAGVVIEATSSGLWLRFNEQDPEQVKQREALMKTLHE